MLHFERMVPEGAADGTTVIVLLHGRGSHERDLLQLGPGLDRTAIIVTPRAPFKGEPWGYGPGWAWYRYLGSNQVEPESFEASQRALDELLAELPEVLGVKPGRVVLGGFSQGGTMSVAYGLEHPDRVDAVLNFSGFLADQASSAAENVSVARVRVFWGHGTQDPSIPFEMALSGRAGLRAMGVAVEERDYPIGHWIAPDELEAAAEWLKEM